MLHCQENIFISINLRRYTGFHFFFELVSGNHPQIAHNVFDLLWLIFKWLTNNNSHQSCPWLCHPHCLIWKLSQYRVRSLWWLVITTEQEREVKCPLHDSPMALARREALFIGGKSIYIKENPIYRRFFYLLP